MNVHFQGLGLLWKIREWKTGAVFNNVGALWQIYSNWKWRNADQKKARSNSRNNNYICKFIKLLIYFISFQNRRSKNGSRLSLNTSKLLSLPNSSWTLYSVLNSLQSHQKINASWIDMNLMYSISNQTEKQYFTANRLVRNI